MRVLITGAASDLGQRIVRELAGEHRLRLFDGGGFAVPAGVEGVQGSLLEADEVWRAVRGVQGIIHTAVPPANLPRGNMAPDEALLDWHTRGTHNLLRAAVDAGVERCVYASTLEVFRGYPDDVYITENWRPSPVPDMAVMGPYLGELVCREFAFENHIGITSLRLGRLAYADAVQGQPPDLMWLDPRDAAQAFACALRADLSQEARGARRWRVLHVCADIPHAKYLIDRARAIGYAPGHDFSAAWAKRSGVACRPF